MILRLKSSQFSMKMHRRLEKQSFHFLIHFIPFFKRNKTGTSQVGTKSKAQKYSRNNYWKHFFKKSQNAEKLKKRPFRLIKRFNKPETSKKMQGEPFDRIRKLSKKKSHNAKKTQSRPFWFRLYVWKY